MKLFVFGLGVTALAFIEAARAQGKLISAHGTVRRPEKVAALARSGVAAHLLETSAPVDGAARDAIEVALREADHVLASIPPGPEGDPPLRAFGPALGRPGRWTAYLSTVAVYGNRAGAWVDETTAPDGASPRARQRLAAEAGWLGLGDEAGANVALFRLGGIYGPGRNPLLKAARGQARRVVKPGQVFNRIHVEDIARALLASAARPRPGAIYNVVDDEPAPPQDVVAHSAALLGLPPPPEVSFEAADLSPMARAFYSDNRRVSNRLLKKELGWRPSYPSYREGLAALLAAGEGRG